MIRRTFVCGKIDAVPMLVFTLPAAFVSSFTKVKYALINKIITYFRLFNDHLHIAGCLFAMNIATGNAALSDVATPCMLVLFTLANESLPLFGFYNCFPPATRHRKKKKTEWAGKKKHNCMTRLTSLLREMS